MKTYKFPFNAILVLCFLTTAITSYSQISYNLELFRDETVHFFKQPLHWDANDWGKLGLLTASTFLLTRIDQPVRDEMFKDRSWVHSAPVEFGRMWGEVYSAGIIGGAFGLYGLVYNDNEAKHIGYEIYQTAFYAGVITTVLKAAIGRARPFTNYGPNRYNPFSIFNDDFHSLPSGHSTLAFALSTALSQNIKQDYLKWLVYIPAVLTAYSRVYQDKHWTSDVFLGAAIGYFVGTWVHNQHEENDNSVSVIPNDLITIRISF